MDKIRKIIQFIEFDEIVKKSDGKIYVFFEDESISPVEVDSDTAYTIYEDIAEEKGISVTIEELDQLRQVVREAAENGVLELCNSLDPIELEAANNEFERAKNKAEELQKEKEGDGMVMIDPIPTPIPVPEPLPEPEPQNPEEDDYTGELEDEVEVNKHTGAKIAAGVLAGAALGAATYGIVENVIRHNKDIDDNQETNIDFDNASFDELMDSLDDNHPRKIASMRAMNLVEAFHDATHKDGNFRIDADKETYLDLSFEEALVLTTFANYSEADQLYQVLGSYDMTSNDAQELLESARNKIMTYYMNAKEPSGLAEMFENEQDRQFFKNMEESVLRFNSEHTTEASDEVIRDVYYNYILDGTTNAPQTNAMTRLIAFDAVFGGIHLTETASENHHQFLEFHGKGLEEETKYYVEKVLKLDYASLSEDEIAKYSQNVLGTGTRLLNVASDVNQQGGLSLTDLVNQTGLCNTINADISEKMHSLDTIVAERTVQIINVNNAIAQGLRDAGLDDLAMQVEANRANALSANLINAIRTSGSTGSDLVENYKTAISSATDYNCPTVEQIVNSANKELNAKENYAGTSKDVSTLINNRRHSVIDKTHDLTEEEKDLGIIEKTEDEIPVFDKDVLEDTLDGKTEEEVEDFIKENGGIEKEEVIDRVETPVDKEDLTVDEQLEVDQQQIAIFTEQTLSNVSADGQIAANAYANSSEYNFDNNIVVNPISGTEYDINEMNFASGVARAQAFGKTTKNDSGLLEQNGDFILDVDNDAQIQNAAEVSAENYLNDFTQEQKDAISKGMNMSWEEARKELKNSYKQGYISQMKTEVEKAIIQGNMQLKATNDALQSAMNATNNSYQDALNGTATPNVAPASTESEIQASIDSALDPSTLESGTTKIR